MDQAVEANYDLCDYEFIQMLQAEIEACFAEGADIEGENYRLVLGAITRQMNMKIGSAQERLQRILSKGGTTGNVKAMEGEIVAMVRRGEVDEALTLLIEGNIQQAEAAGALAAVNVLRVLNKRILNEKEKKLPDEQRLLRALLREQNPEKRKSLIYEAFRPTKTLNSDSTVVEGPPLISPPAFINAARTVIMNVGNIDSSDMNIMDKMQSIINEAQVVATELYGEGMSPRDQQRYMFEKQSVSIWDLAKYEEEAMMTGQEVPWRNDKFDNMSPEEVLMEKGSRKIGGMDDLE